jgi:hypothetical protein
MTPSVLGDSEFSQNRSGSYRALRSQWIWLLRPMHWDGKDRVPPKSCCWCFNTAMRLILKVRLLNLTPWVCSASLKQWICANQISTVFTDEMPQIILLVTWHLSNLINGKSWAPVPEERGYVELTLMISSSPADNPAPMALEVHHRCIIQYQLLHLWWLVSGIWIKIFRHFLTGTYLCTSYTTFMSGSSICMCLMYTMNLLRIIFEIVPGKSSTPHAVNNMVPIRRYSDRLRSLNRHRQANLQIEH